MTALSTRPQVAPETWLDRIGIPHVLRWGFIAVLVFMAGNGVESNFIAPHMAEALGSRAALVPTIITVYGVAVMVASYLSGALSDLVGPRKVMALGFVLWVVFEVLFLLSLGTGSAAAIFATYFFRGLGYPLFAFAFLVWVNKVVPVKRKGTAVGWFYVMFTGGLPTFGSLFALIAIPGFGGGASGETKTLWASIALVTIGFAIVWFGVREPGGSKRQAPANESTAQVLTGGVRLLAKEPRVLAGFVVRLINTAPQYGMFVILPAVIGGELGWSQTQWLMMTVIVFASNIAFNAVFGAIGDKWGWLRTVRWFGIAGSALGLLAWWYVPHMVAPGSDWGYWLSVLAGVIFGILLAGFVPMGAIMPALTPTHQGADMAMYTTAAGGAAFLGAAVVAVVLPWGGNTGVVWAFVALYGVAFALTKFLKVPEDSSRGHQH
ncbi:Predicted arabinose efflux permease, MFS family [Arthrobacter alpinus]|uniref:Predicted arabinose efflux permease, MFS family n=1 Tax=Arthrobacter alpinus TaxID=656366 RepID=A0A1H5NE67_9MICC|nr:MFS transporter [Arthrobacter alpinus]SEE99893.1 Predicted arabinose efflux permease, MFS family [Arthrobacter alpinus]